MKHNENISNVFEEELQQDELKKEVTKDEHEIILHNDDFNTFDHVIKCLVEICKHSTVQAEQCTWLVHYKGECSVKTGSIDKLEPIYKALLDHGLTAELN